MNSKSIVVWGAEDILSSSIQNILADKKEWNVVNISNSDDLDDLIMSITKTHPDTVIIVHQQNTYRLSNYHMQMLQDNTNIKLVIISLVNNLIEIYCKQKILVKHATDLISVIENFS